MNDISKYLEEIKKHKILSEKEIESLFEKVRSWDQDARKKVGESHLVTVVELVSTEKIMMEMSFLDAVQEGNIALFEAIDQYAKRPGKWNSFQEALEYFIEKSFR